MKTSVTVSSFSLALGLTIVGCMKVEWRGGMTPSLKWKGRQEEGRFLDVNASQPESAFRLSGNSTVSEWPDFRGPGRLGVAPDQGVEIDWAKNLVPLWRKPIGAGHSSVVVVQNRIYTLEQIGSFETLTCLSIEDGSVQWQHQREARYHPPEVSGK